MKTTVAGLIVIAVCLFLYNRQHPFGRPAIPEGHEYAADGVYFLRTAYAVSAATGPVQWKQGQQVFADKFSKTPAPDGMRLVTDGSHSAPIPSNMLSEDVQEGQALRQVEIDAQARLDAKAQADKAAEDRLVSDQKAKAEQDRQRAQLEQQRAASEASAAQARLLAAQARQPTPAPTPLFGHTALDQPTLVKPARGGYWYSGRYYYYPAPTP